MDKKIYNLKESSLGKITFRDGSIFVGVSMDDETGTRVQEFIVLPSLEDALKRLSGWMMEKAQLYVKDFLGFHDQIVDWLIENWMENGIMTLKEEMWVQYGFSEFRDMDPVEWIKSEPEMASLVMAHVATRFTNGYIKCPHRNVELVIKLVKNVIGVNFWEEGNPNSSDPIQ